MIAATLGFVGLWLLLDRSAARLGGFRGEAETGVSSPPENY